MYSALEEGHGDLGSLMLVIDSQFVRSHRPFGAGAGRANYSLFVLANRGRYVVVKAGFEDHLTSGFYFSFLSLSRVTNVSNRNGRVSFGLRVQTHNVNNASATVSLISHRSTFSLSNLMILMLYQCIFF